VAALLSRQDAETIGPVATAVRDGLVQLGLETRMLLVDCGSTDATVARARAALAGDVLELASAPAAADKLDVPYHGLPGKARALRATLTQVQDLDASACVIFDGSVRTATPRWVDWMARPVLEHDFDFVSPFYLRQPVEGALTKGLVYPLVRALYGVRLRQPAAAEFACSRRLVDYFLDEDVWDRDGAQVGIDLWLTTAAASGDFRLGEAELGLRTHHAREGAARDLSTTMAQVVGALFADLAARAERWQRTRGSVPVPRFGAAPRAATAARPKVEIDRLIEAFHLGHRELRDVWTWLLPPRTLVDLRKLADATTTRFQFDDALWARVVYDFAVGYRLRALPRDHLLRSLVPLYSGWLASFLLQVGDLDADAADARVDDLAAGFERQKPYLISRWRWPERFRTG
jgi:hypothetical protein